MDKVLLPFVVSQDFTFTVKDAFNIHNTCSSQIFQKQQWTIHVLVNAGMDEDKIAWVDLVSKGLSLQIKKEEIKRYYLDMFWQRTSWVDGKVIQNLAPNFIEVKRGKHGKEWGRSAC